MQRRQEVFTINNEQDEKLHCILQTKTGQEKQLVILCHGLLCDNNSVFLPTLYNFINNDSIAVLRFDFSGEGLSDGVFEYGNYQKQVRDLNSVIQHMRSRFKIYAVIGHSKGANVVLMLHNFFPQLKIPLVIAVSGRFDLSREPPNRFTPEQREKLSKESKFLWRKKTVYCDGSVSFIRPCWVTQQSIHNKVTTDMNQILQSQSDSSTHTRIVLIHGDADGIIPVADCRAMNKVLKDHSQMIIVEGADHFFSKHMTQIQHVISDLLLTNFSHLSDL